MKSLNIFLFEWKHFIRNPFKVVILILFTLAGIYALHNGAALYKKQQAEIEKITQEIEEERQNTIKYYDEGKTGPEDRPWVDVTSPYWAMRYTDIHLFKQPSSAMVYGIGQAEQFGFYKQVTFFSSPFDADMAEEIANPERLQKGTLDFSFVLLFLLPLVLLILSYNIRSYENEQGFLQLILVQNASKNSWVVFRLLFYLLLIFLTVLILLLYGAMLTDVLTYNSKVFLEITFIALIYIVFWGILFFFILRKGKNILSNTLQMIGLYLLLTIIIPATVHQWVSIEKPANLMVEFIDATREKREELYDEPDDVKRTKLIALHPEIKQTVVFADSIRSKRAVNRSMAALTNQLTKQSLKPIIEENNQRNELIESTYWFNPIVFFQNKLNRKTETHYLDYQDYRDQIQASVDLQIQLLLLDIFNDVQVDKKRYLNYIKQIEND